jgi:hypothetical protein
MLGLLHFINQFQMVRVVDLLVQIHVEDLVVLGRNRHVHILNLFIVVGFLD